jgi:hypothetical protein
MVQYHGETPSMSLVCPLTPTIGPAGPAFLLVALEGTQADAIQQCTHLFLRAAFLDREPDDVLLTWTHAVNRRSKLGTANGTRRPVQTWEDQCHCWLTSWHNTQELSNETSDFETEPVRFGKILTHHRHRGPQWQGIDNELLRLVRVRYDAPTFSFCLAEPSLICSRNASARQLKCICFKWQRSRLVLMRSWNRSCRRAPERRARAWR